jgi:hypothetical protein
MATIIQKTISTDLNGNKTTDDDNTKTIKQLHHNKGRQSICQSLELAIQYKGRGYYFRI